MNQEWASVMEFQIGPAYIWMAVCIGLLLVILLLSSLICCFCCSQRSSRLQSRKNQNRSQRLGSSRLAVHRPQDLEDEEQAKLAILTRSFSTFNPKPLPSNVENQPEFPELRTVSARGASTSAPSLIVDGSFRSPLFFCSFICTNHLKESWSGDQDREQSRSRHQASALEGEHSSCSLGKISWR